MDIQYYPNGKNVELDGTTYSPLCKNELYVVNGYYFGRDAVQTVKELSLPRNPKDWTELEENMFVFHLYAKRR